MAINMIQSLKVQKASIMNDNKIKRNADDEKVWEKDILPLTQKKYWNKQTKYDKIVAAIKPVKKKFIPY